MSQCITCARYWYNHECKNHICGKDGGRPIPDSVFNSECDCPTYEGQTEE